MNTELEEINYRCFILGFGCIMYALYSEEPKLENIR